jgi:hypothetical protein
MLPKRENQLGNQFTSYIGPWNIRWIFIFLLKKNLTGVGGWDFFFKKNLLCKVRRSQKVQRKLPKQGVVSDTSISPCSMDDEQWMKSPTNTTKETIHIYAFPCQVFYLNCLVSSQLIPNDNYPL